LTEQLQYIVYLSRVMFRSKATSHEFCHTSP
jgi:hypothetical protein